MDLSPLIFVALAVLWIVYLVPKVRRHSDELRRSRPVDEISDQARVIARRDAVDSRSAAFVVNRPSRTSAAVETPAAETVPAHVAVAEDETPLTVEAPTAEAATEPAEKAKTKKTTSPAQRRRRVLGLLLAVLTGVGAAAALVPFHAVWTAVPAALVLGWLVACRLMVRRPARRSARRPAARPETTTAPEMVEVYDETGQIVQVPADVVPAEAGEVPHVATLDPVTGSWDMVPMTLPTYVNKPAAARRYTRQLDHDATGVWSSGRNQADSDLARRAEEERKDAAERARAAGRRTGS